MNSLIPNCNGSRAPQDFSERLRRWQFSGPLGGFAGADVACPGSEPVDQLAKALDKARGNAGSGGEALAPLTPFRLAVLSNSTIDMIVPALVASAARHGIALEVIQPSYDQWRKKP